LRGPNGRLLQRASGEKGRSESMGTEGQNRGGHPEELQKQKWKDRREQLPHQKSSEEETRERSKVL